jgi:hypothetical protein
MEKERGLTAFNRNSDIDLGKETTGEIVLTCRDVL